MASRDELAERIGNVYNRSHVDPAGRTADALIAERWRQMPTVQRIAEALHADNCPDEECDGGDMGNYERQAEVVLALTEESN